MKTNQSGKTQNDRGMTRRSFVRGSLAAAAGLTILPACATSPRIGRRPRPSGRINIAVIGTGGQGLGNIRRLLRFEDVQVVALCDVNQFSDYSAFYYGGVAGLAPALDEVESFYAEQAKSGSYKGCATYGDFNEMLDRESDIDAVLVATPDHVHAVACMAAINRGKHVYCEKPLAHSIHEVRVVTEAARKKGVMTQMGNQGHSGEGIRLAVEWIRDGAIGTVREVHGSTSAGGSEWVTTNRRPVDTPPMPEGLDWDRWLGPAEYRPYHSAYAPYNWRGWWDFGTAGIGDMACHNLDPAFWALDLGYPTSVEARATGHSDETVPTGSKYRYEFPARGGRPPVTMYWYDGDEPRPRPEELEPERGFGGEGVHFVGDDGVLIMDGWGESPRIIPETKMRAYDRPDKTIPRVPGHHRSWIDACKGGDPVHGNFDYSGPMTETILLGNVALRTGKKLQWDGERMKAANAPEAEAYVQPKYRKGWEL